ncbi:MAG: hypothetical protein N4A33_12865 [Bacteriovoracaceae bacterium]|jgi:hypothetical protein|nr:hypothetical protein [Bacteriovoracaceae bacterium]
MAAKDYTKLYKQRDKEKAIEVKNKILELLQTQKSQKKAALLIEKLLKNNKIK